MPGIKTETTIKIDGSEVIKVLKEHLKKEYGEVEFDFLAINDDRKYEWEHRYSIDYIEFKKAE